MKAFSSSDEACAAEALFQAYRSGDAGTVKECVASQPSFLELDNQVGMLLQAVQSAVLACGRYADDLLSAPTPRHTTLLQGASKSERSAASCRWRGWRSGCRRGMSRRWRGAWAGMR